MKKKSLKLDKPCQENWDKMPEAARGRFCQQCAKTVLDLSQASVAEIVLALENNQGSVCAKISKRQLDFPLYQLERNTATTTFPFPRIGIAALLAGSLLASPGCEPQANVAPEMEQTSAIFTNSTVDQKEKAALPAPTPEKQEAIDFKGTIVAEKTGEAIEHAQILLLTLSKVYGCYTDENGNFSLSIPGAALKELNVVHFNFEERKFPAVDLDTVTTFYLSAYENETRLLSKGVLQKNFRYQASAQEFYLGGVRLSREERKDPVVMVHGAEISFDAYVALNSTDRAKFYHLHEEEAMELIGERGKYGLFFTADLQVQK